MVSIKHNQSGYVALLAVLIVGAAATAIALALLTIGTDAQRSMLVEQQSKQARGLAVACGEEALQQIHDNVALGATNSTLSLGQGTCAYNVSVNTGATRTITATGTVANVVRKISASVTVGASTITISSWKDVNVTAAAVSHIQSIGSTNDTTATTIAQAFGSNNTAGNLIVAAVSWNSAAATTVMCSDSQNNPYTVVNIWNDTTNSRALSICYAPSVKAGANTVTATFGASSTFRRIIVSEYSGAVALSPYDVSAGVGGSTGTTATDGVTSGSATTSQGGELIYGAVMDTGTITTVAAGTGFTQRFSLNSKDLAVQDQQQSAAGALASTQTFGTSQRYNAGMVTFKPASQ